ncbi:MAG: hypothetical protein ACJ8F7_15295 [Gemmataceae bacterium]
MWRLFALVSILLIMSGCAAFDDALKDLRGDNMQMRYNSEASKSLEPGSLQH